jgi:hypothetical protein
MEQLASELGVVVDLCVGRDGRLGCGQSNTGTTLIHAKRPEWGDTPGEQVYQMSVGVKIGRGGL